MRISRMFDLLQPARLHFPEPGRLSCKLVNGGFTKTELVFCHIKGLQYACFPIKQVLGLWPLVQPLLIGLERVLQANDFVFALLGRRSAWVVVMDGEGECGGTSWVRVGVCVVSFGCSVRAQRVVQCVLPPEPCEPCVGRGGLVSETSLVVQFSA